MSDASQNIDYSESHVTRGPAEDAHINLSGDWRNVGDLEPGEMAMVWALSPFTMGNSPGPSPALAQAINHKLDTLGYVIINNCPYRERRFFEDDANKNAELLAKIDDSNDVEALIQASNDEDADIMRTILCEQDMPERYRYHYFSALDAQIGNHKHDLRGIMRSVGQVISFENEGGDGDISIIKPSKQVVNAERSFKTSGEFELHTDMSYQKAPPKYMGLMVGQSDLQRHAQMQFARIDDAVKLLSRDTIRELKKEQFLFALPKRGQDEGLSADGKNYVTGSILKKFSLLGGYELRFRKDTVTVATPAAQLAIDALAAAFDKVRFGLVPQPGTVVIVNNRQLVHGRTPFVATYDDDDRYLLRAYANDSLG